VGLSFLLFLIPLLTWRLIQFGKTSDFCQIVWVLPDCLRFRRIVCKCCCNLMLYVDKEDEKHLTERKMFL